MEPSPYDVLLFPEVVETRASLIADGGTGLFTKIDLKAGEVFMDVKYSDLALLALIGMANDSVMPDVHCWINARTSDALAMMRLYSASSISGSNCDFSFLKREDWVEGQSYKPEHVQLRALHAIKAGSELLHSYGAVSWLAMLPVPEEEAKESELGALAKAFLALNVPVERRGTEFFLWRTVRLAAKLQSGPPPSAALLAEAAALFA